MMRLISLAVGALVFLFAVAADAKPKGATLEDAFDRYVFQEYQQAIDIASQFVRSEPNRAWPLIVLSRCWLKDTTGARRDFAKVPEERRVFVKSNCSRIGVVVVE